MTVITRRTGNHRPIHSSRLDELFAATRSKLKFNNPVSFDEKRPTRAVEELHQVAATRTERRLFAPMDFRREMRPIAFVDPGAFQRTNPARPGSGTTKNQVDERL